MPYWKCYFHIVWSTKNRQPLISPIIETVLFPAIESKSVAMGCPVLAINGTVDHVHTAVCIPPNLAVATWVGEVKGASSRSINQAFPQIEERFRWQSGYGVLSFGEKYIDFVVDYIQRQKEHHQQGTFNAHLERSEDNN